MAREYFSILHPVNAEIEVKNSRFLCVLAPCDDETDARALIEQQRKKHWNARHHCSAFILGPRGDVRRSNDDGEPSGTAGMPMLDVLAGAGLTDVVAVVTRWFGGTLLGTGGLVKAYGDAVRAALEVAQRCTYREVNLWHVDVPLAFVGRVEHAVRGLGARIDDVDYGLIDADGQAGSARLRYALSASASEVADAAVAQVLSGSASIVADGQAWVLVE